MNTFGKMIRLTTFGESHGPAMGGILDGMPSGVKIDLDKVQAELDRRAPGRCPDTSQRKESDKVEFLSGFSADAVTLGSPIGFIIRNCDARSEDYKDYNAKFRPNHADFTYFKKYGIHDFRGGGRASARETVSWVVAGAICRQLLESKGVEIHARFIETNPVSQTAADGDSTGGIVECEVTGMPIGVGEPVADKLHARLAAAMMGINAAKAFEYGDGFASASSFGSEQMDKFESLDSPVCSSNHSGGVQGGISNGMPVLFRVYFKPTPTVMKPVETIDVEGNKVTIPPKGRHDPCVAIRAVPVVEAMASVTIADLMRMSGLIPVNMGNA